MKISYRPKTSTIKIELSLTEQRQFLSSNAAVEEVRKKMKETIDFTVNSATVAPTCK